MRDAYTMSDPTAGATIATDGVVISRRRRSAQVISGNSHRPTGDASAVDRGVQWTYVDQLWSIRSRWVCRTASVSGCEDAGRAARSLLAEAEHPRVDVVAQRSAVRLIPAVMEEIWVDG